jgi:N-glycosylase/DNA lyase
MPARLIIPITYPLHLAWTLESGQAFRWRRAGNAFTGTIEGDLFILRHAGQSLLVQATAPAETVMPTLRRYFRLDDDLDEIAASYAHEPVLARLFACWRGLRLLQVPVWECAVGFLCSSQNNIRRIEGIMERLSVVFGAPVRLGRTARHAFPSAEVLADAGEARLRALGLGYRAAFVAGTADLAARGGFDLEEAVLRLPYADAKKRLLELPGVGEKVADCILLYAGAHEEAFPVDRWIRRALDRWYVEGQGFKKYEEYRAWAVGRFGRHAAYAQQYLFQGLRLGGRLEAG